jgi:hypothetical protein
VKGLSIGGSLNRGISRVGNCRIAGKLLLQLIAVSSAWRNFNWLVDTLTYAPFVEPLRDDFGIRPTDYLLFRWYDPICISGKCCQNSDLDSSAL